MSFLWGLLCISHVLPHALSYSPCSCDVLLLSSLLLLLQLLWFVVRFCQLSGVPQATSGSDQRNNFAVRDVRKWHIKIAPVFLQYCWAFFSIKMPSEKNRGLFHACLISRLSHELPGHWLKDTLFQLSRRIVYEDYDCILGDPRVRILPYTV